MSGMCSAHLGFEVSCHRCWSDADAAFEYANALQSQAEAVARASDSIVDKDAELARLRAEVGALRGALAFARDEFGRIMVEGDPLTMFSLADNAMMEMHEALLAGLTPTPTVEEVSDE